MSDSTSLKLAEPLADAIIDAFKKLFPEKLAEVSASYDDGIELPPPLESAYLFGIRPWEFLSTVPAVMVDIDSGDMPSESQDAGGGRERTSPVLLRFCVEHPDIDTLPRIAARYVRAGLLVILDSESNGLFEAGGYVVLDYADDYSPMLYNDEEKLFGRDAHLVVQIYSVEG